MNVRTSVPKTSSSAALGRNGFLLSPDILPGVVRTLDLALIATAGTLCYSVNGDFTSEGLERHVFGTIFVGLCYMFLSAKAGLNSLNAIMRPTSRADDVIVALATATLLFLSVAFSLKEAEDFWRLWVLGFAVGSATLVIAGRIGLRRVVGRLAARRVIGRSMVVLGAGEQARRFLRSVHTGQPYFVHLEGVFADDFQSGDTVEGVPALGGLDDLIALARERRLDDIVVALPWNADRRVAETVETLKELPVNVYLSADLVGFELAFRPAVGAFTALPMFEVVQRPLSGWSQALKQLEDYILASVAVVLILPLLALIALAIKLDSPGPVLFRQKRLGFNNQEFEIYKFRSMYHGRQPETVVFQATKNDPRVTRVGRVLRATSLDELPQLFNVLNGTMSLVGPRPHAVSHNHEYGRQIRGYFARHRVKPGVTGWAQVNGYRGETERIEKMEARIRHDIYYAENWSVFFDIRIIALTVATVLFQKTAY